jgi:uncharacterized membrane protein
MIARLQDGLKDRIAGSLWFIPGLFAAGALASGLILTLIRPGPQSPWFPLGFQGNAEDARALLATIASTVVTVIALMLGLTVVALQMSSTQFSPRLLRSFLRDRPNQVSLGVFVATFVYASCGLFTVGVGNSADEYPRLAVSAALLWLFASLAMVVYFADHVAHSIQVDAIMLGVERNVVAAMPTLQGAGYGFPTPSVPDRHVVVRAAKSGYIQAMHPQWFLPVARRHGLHALLRNGVGDHVVEGAVLGWVWGGEHIPQDIDVHLRKAVRIGFERTLEQDLGFGMRQLLDSACKALSPAVNDPDASITVPGRTLQDFLVVVCGLLRRYGNQEPAVMRALLRLLEHCVEVNDDPDRLRAIRGEAEMIAETAEREMGQPQDAARVRALAIEVQAQIDAKIGSGADVPAVKAIVR